MSPKTRDNLDALTAIVWFLLAILTDNPTYLVAAVLMRIILILNNKK